jgi:hypothetical protein
MLILMLMMQGQIQKYAQLRCCLEEQQMVQNSDVQLVAGNHHEDVCKKII